MDTDDIILCAVDVMCYAPYPWWRSFNAVPKTVGEHTAGKFNAVSEHISIGCCDLSVVAMDPKEDEGSGITTQKVVTKEEIARHIDEVAKLLDVSVHDAGEWDADAGDALLQMAMFREIVYG